MAEMQLSGEPEAFFLRVLDVFKQCNLEALLVGNAAALIHGAPVTTRDADFVFRPTPLNLRKLKRAASLLKVSLSQPFFPASEVYRLEGGSFDIDMMPSMPGFKFESLRAKTEWIDLRGRKLRVAGLDLIIQMKERAGRPKDKAVMHVLKNTQKVLSEKRDLDKGRMPEQ